MGGQKFQQVLSVSGCMCWIDASQSSLLASVFLVKVFGYVEEGACLSIPRIYRVVVVNGRLYERQL